MLFEPLGLGMILKRYRLIVPPNQREYSWERKEHVETLLDDWTKAISENVSEYFLGTIVAVEKAPGLLEIVDGQQRLATTAIFLCELRNYLKTIEPKVSQHITTTFLSEIDLSTKDEVPKMQLNVRDNEYFTSHIKEDATPLEATKSSHELINAAFQASNKHIKKIVAAIRDPKDHGTPLIKWLEYIQHNSIVILLQVDNKFNAYKMFETLNDRGLKTSQADLVKNYLFGEAGNSRQAEAQQKWDLMRGALDSAYEGDVTVIYLRHALIMMRGHLKEADVLDETERIARGSSQALSFLDNLEKYSNTYAAIINPEHDRWNKYPDAVNRAIKTLNQFKIQPFQPLLLAIAERFQPNEASEAMKMIITLGVRLLIASSTRSGSVEETLAEGANLIFTDKIKDTKNLIIKIDKIIPKDKEFQLAFENTTVSKASLARYYLRSLEMAAKKQPAPWFIPNDDKETINLEHILPEKPGDNWPHFTPEAVHVYCRRLGNLLLLTSKSNSDLRSANFETKKNEYKKSGGYLLTSQVANLTREWTEEQIENRQKKLAELALEAWPI